MMEIGANVSRLDGRPARRSSGTSRRASGHFDRRGPACYLTRDWRRSARRLAGANALTGGGTVGAGLVRQDFIELTPRSAPHHESPTQGPGRWLVLRARLHVIPLTLSFLGKGELVSRERPGY